MQKLVMKLYCKRKNDSYHAGWKEVYENRFDDEEASDDLKEQILPRIEKGDILNIKINCTNIWSNKTACTL